LERRCLLIERPYGWLGHFDAMASTCEVHVACPDRQTAMRVLEAVAAEAWRVECKYSRYLAGNIVHRINTSAGRTVVVDEETARLLDYANELFDLSDGRFDVTSGVLRRCWKFDRSDRVPSPDAVRQALYAVGWKRVRWQSPELTMANGMEIDFGGIGKEYAVDRAGAAAGAFSQSCLLNFGGDLLALGPAREAPWQVGVEGITETSLPVRRIELYRGALATSGDTQRYLLKDGKRYGHILDPRTGWPVENAPRSVTVAAPTCTQAGMLATFAMLHGPEAIAFLDAQQVRYWCQ
jgi:thiamine biosynthesis lipoprotein